MSALCVKNFMKFARNFVFSAKWKSMKGCIPMQNLNDAFTFPYFQAEG